MELGPFAIVFHRCTSHVLDKEDAMQTQREERMQTIGTVVFIVGTILVVVVVFIIPELLPTLSTLWK